MRASEEEVWDRGNRAVERLGGERVQAAMGAAEVTLCGPNHTGLVSQVKSYINISKYTQMHTYVLILKQIKPECGLILFFTLY